MDASGLPKSDDNFARVPEILVDHKPRDAAALKKRRVLVLTLNVITMAGFIWAMFHLLASGGMTWVDWLMMAAYLFTVPWLSIGFWNGLIGFVIYNRSDNPARHVNPHVPEFEDNAPIISQTAIAMAVRNEDPSEAIAKLEAIRSDLAATPFGHCFDIHVLSDTNDPVIARREELLVKGWQRNHPGKPGIHYRRRTDNRGFKAGNIEEFVDRCHRDYDFFLPLDADSSMSASAILKLVRMMQRSPHIGILQGLVVGSPSKSLFTRAFQFGMRHGMRSFTLGSAWWQGDCGPFWGHNAVIRIKAFQQHCKLPRIERAGPLSGDIMSHDQVEAVLMRRAGYEVRVLACEDESFEENPPSLPDFIKREVRWCLGNMQYWWLLGMKGLKVTSRVQLLLAILMYASAPAWILFVVLGATLAGATNQFATVSAEFGLGLFIAIMAFNLMPKFMGLAQTLANGQEANRYGGRLRVAAGGFVELFMSLLIAPAVAMAITICCVGLLFGRKMTWDAQQRSRDRLSWREAARSLWPQTFLGAALTAWLAFTAPWAMIFGIPVLASLVLSIPFAAITTNPILSGWIRGTGLFDIPEERKVALLGREDEAPQAQAA